MNIAFLPILFYSIKQNTPIYTTDEGDGIRPRCPVPSTRGVLPKGFFLPPPDTTHEQHEWNKQTETQGSWEDMVDAVESGKPGKVKSSCCAIRRRVWEFVNEGGRCSSRAQHIILLIYFE